MIIEFVYTDIDGIESVEKINVSKNEKIRSIFYKIYREKENFEYRVIEERPPFSFNLFFDSQNVTNYQTSDWGIKYKLNNDGSIYLLKNYDSLNSDYTLDEFNKLKDLGFLTNTVNRIEFKSPYGLGAVTDIDIENFKIVFAILKLICKIFSKILSIFSENKKVKQKINEIIKYTKKKNNIENIVELRELFDDVRLWSTEKAKNLLSIDEESAVFLLEYQGFELKKNEWIESNNKLCIKRKKIWKRLEKKHEKFKEVF